MADFIVGPDRPRPSAGSNSFVPRLVTAAMCALALLCALSSVVAGQSVERATDRYLNSIRTRPRRLTEFLHRMPKGGDLHMHITGAVYAESYVRWSAAASSPRLCVDSTSLALSPESPDKPCSDPARPPVGEALTNSQLYNRLIDAWSMRNWRKSGESGHDHFFRSFGKFSAGINGHFGDMLAEVAARAARENASYLELMLTPDDNIAIGLGQKLKWTGDFQAMRNELLDDIVKSVEAGRETLDAAVAAERKDLNCDGPRPDPGCKVAVRFIFQVGRTNPPAVAYAQMVAAMELAKADPRLVALNLVAPEDSKSSLDNFADQMKMLDYLHSVYPSMHITLHAGELVPSLVPPDALKSHIRDSVEIAHAERIGHGVDVLHERDPQGLLQEMARRKILVEICLSSNDEILGVSGKAHPLSTYIKSGVPVAIATDDQGIARSDITKEYMRAVRDQGLGYSDLKQMARNSLEYSFAPGASLWQNRDGFVPVAECAEAFARETNFRHGSRETSPSCREYLSGNEKASLEWDLEKRFRRFEQSGKK
ncbi:MAG TPA: adenosine deaminase [Blastocatellia bacterium]